MAAISARGDGPDPRFHGDPVARAARQICRDRPRAAGSVASAARRETLTAQGAKNPLFGAEQPVAGVAEAGKDIAVIVEAAVDRGSDDRDLGKDPVEFLDALGRGDEADKLDRPRLQLDQARD